MNQPHEEKPVTLNTIAVYENGLLRTPDPLPLREGETVQLVVTSATPRPTDDEILALMKQAKSPQELFASADAYVTAPSGYDLCDALDATRRRDGAAPLFHEK
jgi:predicted DNA-binding antitoxin AbrB/MazE fold protein